MLTSVICSTQAQNVNKLFQSTTSITLYFYSSLKQTRSYINKLCERTPQYAPPPASRPFDLESGVLVTCDVAYLCANFSLPRHLCSRLRPDVRDRQTSDAHHRLMPLPRGGAIIMH